jgi:hypothetical protein
MTMTTRLGKNDSSCGVVSVTALSHREFRALLVDNFNVLYHQGRVLGQRGSLLRQETFLRSYNLGTVIIDRVLITLISLFWFIMIRTVVSCLNDCLALGTFLIEAHFAPPHHFKLSFGVTTCTAHPLRALPTTMVRWNGHALKAFANVLRFLLSSICFCRSTASVCSSCKWRHGLEITCTWHKSARMLNKNRRRR